MWHFVLFQYPQNDLILAIKRSDMGKLIINDSEEEKIKRALARTHTERFHFLMKLIRINRMLQKAKITYPNNPQNGYPG